MTVETSNQSYDPSVISLTIEFTSMLSQSPQKTASTSFVVEVKNKCRDVQLEPAEWLETLVKFDFRNTANFINFVRASFLDDLSCNSASIAYSLIDL